MGRGCAAGDHFRPAALLQTVFGVCLEWEKSQENAREPDPPRVRTTGTGPTIEREKNPAAARECWEKCEKAHVSVRLAVR